MDPQENELLHRRVEGLAAEVAGLRQELESDRDALRREVVTERVVVASPDGFARVVLVATPDHGHVTVHSRTTRAEPTCIDVFANDLDGTRPRGRRLHGGRDGRHERGGRRGGRHQLLEHVTGAAG